MHLEICETTMDEGLLWLEKQQRGERTGLILSDLQTKGRGQYQRVWQSLRGNLSLSVAFMIPQTLKTFSELAFVGAVALGGALRTLYPNLPFFYKWPNDVIIEEKKVGGILTETHELKGKRGVVMGFGVNLEIAPVLPRSYQTISLKEVSGRSTNPLEFLEVLVPLFDTYKKLWLKEGLLKIAKEWEHHALYLKEPVRIMTTYGGFEGVFQGIDHQGFFKLQLPSGEMRSFSSVEIMKET